VAMIVVMMLVGVILGGAALGVGRFY
jgi:hypothetical protein